MKELGKILPEEVSKLEKVFRRKLALTSVFLSLSSNRIADDIDQDAMYERLLEDLADVEIKISSWWTEISKQYNWEYSMNQKWKVDFNTGVVFLFD